jgi:hypothetical protein
MGSNVDHQKRQCLEGGYPYTTCRADADGNITLPAPETEIFQETRYAKHWHIAKLKHLSRYLARTGHGDVCTQSKNGKWYYLSEEGDISSISSPAGKDVLIVRDPGHLHPYIVRMQKERRNTTRV